MKAARRLTAIIEREEDGYVALCPELDVASQGASIEDARVNLIEALTLFSEIANPSRSPAACMTTFLLLGSRCRLGRLRVLSGPEVCRILEQHGFVAVRRHGSHRVRQKRWEGSTITVPVPLHDSVRRGTLRSIIRQSELPKSLFEAENQAAHSRATTIGRRRQTGKMVIPVRINSPTPWKKAIIRFRPLVMEPAINRLEATSGIIALLVKGHDSEDARHSPHSNRKRASLYFLFGASGSQAARQSSGREPR